MSKLRPKRFPQVSLGQRRGGDRMSAKFCNCRIIEQNIAEGGRYAVLRRSR